MNVLRAVLWKDLLIEWRSRERSVAMLVFALLVVVILYLAAPPADTPEARAALPGMLWVAYIFAAVLGLNRAFALELDEDALTGLALAPADRGFIFLGKTLASFVLLLGVQAVTALAFGLAFGVNFAPVALPFAGVAALGALGICVVGTFCSAMAIRTRYREAMLPLLMLPLLLPILLGAVRATDALLNGEALPGLALQLLLVSDGVFTIVCYLGFDAVLDE